MENIGFGAKNITIKEASKIIGKSEQFIRQGIIEGYLPIGVAFKRGNSSHYSYYIIPKRLYEFTGYIPESDSSRADHETLASVTGGEDVL